MGAKKFKEYRAKANEQYERRHLQEINNTLKIIATEWPLLRRCEMAVRIIFKRPKELVYPK